MSNSKLLKSIIKKTLPNDVTPSFGTDPKDPWSAKANIAEGAPIVVMPSPERLKKAETKKVDLSKIGTPVKPPSTEKRGVKGRSGQRPMPQYEQAVVEGSEESHMIIRTDAEGKKDVFAKFSTYEKAQKELDGLLDHPLHTKYKQKFEIKRKGGEQRVAEESDMSESESSILSRYLKSRGLNPEFASKDQKIAHSKTGQFIKWKRDHMLESDTSLEEAVDKRDTVTFDIPFLIRVLEYVREDIKSDIDLHKVVTSLITIRNKGVLTMKHYQFITRLREEVSLDEKEADYGPEYQDKVKSVGDKAKQGPKKTVWVPAKYGTGGQYKVVPVGDIKEYMEPMAATQSPGDGANSPDDVEPMPKGKKLITMSKSASIVKGLYKSPTIKEDAYDPEKEEKPAATMGKKPKMQKDPEDTTSGKPLAAAIMSGGKTLTGTPRDVIEIDPLVIPRRPDSEKR